MINSLRSMALAAGMAMGGAALAAVPPPGDTPPIHTVDGLSTVPTRIVKMGHSNYMAHGHYGLIDTNLGRATVSRNAQRISIDVGDKHMTITPDAANPRDVMVHWTSRTQNQTHEAQIRPLASGFEAHGTDSDMDFIVYQMPNGQVKADAKGLVPGTAHVTLTPTR